MVTDKPVCQKCGRIHVTFYGGPACRAHLTSDGVTPCKQSPINGAAVCRSHGGASRVARVKAEERRALMAAQGEIATLMRECDIPEQHPVEGLLEVVRVSGAMMRLLTLKVGELREEPELEEVLVEGAGGALSTRLRARGEAFWGLNHLDEMTPHIYVQMLRTWADRYERACKTALEAGVAERQVQIAERQGELFAAAIRGILTDLDVINHPEATAIVRRHLTALPAS